MGDMSCTCCAMASSRVCGCAMWRPRATCRFYAPDIVDFKGVTFSPDGNFIYYVRSDKTTQNYSYLYQMPVLGGNPRQLIRDIDAPVGIFTGRITDRIRARLARSGGIGSSPSLGRWQRGAAACPFAYLSDLHVGSKLVAGWEDDCALRAEKRERRELCRRYHSRGGWQRNYTLFEPDDF